MMQTAIGFPWFEPEDYPVLRHLFSDGDRLPPSFDAWYADASEALKLFRDQGLAVIQVRIEPDPFYTWCAERGLRADYRARHQFVLEIARTGAA